jgi:hypothetical protein
MLSHDLRLNVGSNFIYVAKAILIVNVGCKCFIIANWHFSSSGWTLCKVGKPCIPSKWSGILQVYYFWKWHLDGSP